MCQWQDSNPYSLGSKSPWLTKHQNDSTQSDKEVRREGEFLESYYTINHLRAGQWKVISRSLLNVMSPPSCLSLFLPSTLIKTKLWKFHLNTNHSLEIIIITLWQKFSFSWYKIQAIIMLHSLSFMNTGCIYWMPYQFDRHDCCLGLLT